MFALLTVYGVPALKENEVVVLLCSCPLGVMMTPCRQESGMGKLLLPFTRAGRWSWFPPKWWPRETRKCQLHLLGRLSFIPSQEVLHKDTKILLTFNFCWRAAHRAGKCTGVLTAGIMWLHVHIVVSYSESHRKTKVPGSVLQAARYAGSMEAS